MTYNNFLKITLGLQKQGRILDNLYKNSVDLYDLIDPYHHIITISIEEIYGKEGLGWFEWFCFENDFGNGGLEASDEDGNPICFSHESLWKYLEENHAQINKEKDETVS